jgi:putative transcriptional regulator
VLRAERWWSQQELADSVGVTRLAISAIENGRRDPGLALAYRIAEAFQNTIEEVFPKEQQTPDANSAQPPEISRRLSRTRTFELRNNLQALRLERLWSPRDLAQRLGVSEARLRSIECGRLLPNVLLACNLAELFGKSVCDIFPYRPKQPMANDPSEFVPPPIESDAATAVFSPEKVP